MRGETELSCGTRLLESGKNEGWAVVAVRKQGVVVV